MVLNPVRAGMVNDLHEWHWSSYAAMIGNVTAPDWLETDWLLACFDESKKQAITAYIDFVRAGIGLPSVWENLKFQIYLGNDDFIENIQCKLDQSNKNSLKEVSRLQRRPLAKPLSWYEKNFSDRKQAMATAYASGDYSMKEISEYFAVHYSTVSRSVRQFEGK